METFEFLFIEYFKNSYKIFFQKINSKVGASKVYLQKTFSVANKKRKEEKYTFLNF